MCTRDHHVKHAVTPCFPASLLVCCLSSKLLGFESLCAPACLGRPQHAAIVYVQAERIIPRRMKAGSFSLVVVLFCEPFCLVLLFPCGMAKVTLLWTALYFSYLFTFSVFSTRLETVFFPLELVNKKRNYRLFSPLCYLSLR